MPFTWVTIKNYTKKELYRFRDYHIFNIVYNAGNTLELLAIFNWLPSDIIKCEEQKVFKEYVWCNEKKKWFPFVYTYGNQTMDFTPCPCLQKSYEILRREESWSYPLYNEVNLIYYSPPPVNNPQTEEDKKGEKRERDEEEQKKREQEEKEKVEREKLKIRQEAYMKVWNATEHLGYEERNQAIKKEMRKFSEKGDAFDSWMNEDDDDW